ncbi:MAG: AI-2E family transporter [Cyanophyceae cyanobacterium]
MKPLPILQVIIAVILAIAAIRSARVVTLPLAFAFLIAVLVYPLQKWLERYLPHWLSAAAVVLLLASFLGLGIWILELSVEIIEPKAPEYLERFQQLAQNALTWLQQRGIPVAQLSSSQGSLGRFASEAIAGVRTLWSVLGLFVLVVSLLCLLLLEVGDYRQKVSSSFSRATSDKIVEAFTRMSHKLRRFVLVQAFTSLLTGILTGLWCLILGVDLAFVWGVIALVLNFVPTIGSLIAVIPPSLLALLFNGVGQGVATLVGLVTIQYIMGNFVDPRLQGRSLAISPFVALLSIIFWGWVWGIPGAFIAIPTTVSIVVLCQEFEPTRPFAALLADVDDAAGEGERRRQARKPREE